MITSTGLTLANIFKWAWENGIDVSLERSLLGGAYHPILRFTRGGFTQSFMFSSLERIADDFPHQWQGLALQLCVKPYEG